MTHNGHVGEVSDSRSETGNTGDIELEEKVEIEESDSTLENENVTIAPNATIIPDPNVISSDAVEQNKNEQKQTKITATEQKVSKMNETKNLKNSKNDNRPTKIDDARIVWTKLISNCLAIVRVAVDLFSSGKGFSLKGSALG